MKNSFRIIKYDVPWGSRCSKNKRCWPKKALTFAFRFPWIFVKNRYKIVKKRVERLFAQKSIKKTRLELDFLANSQFLTDFRSPSGSPERSKRDEQHWQKLLPGAIWCNFVALQALLSLLAPFQFPSCTTFNTILTPFCLLSGIIFIPLWHKRDCLPAVQHDCDASAGPWKLPCVRSKIFAERCLRQWWYPQCQWSGGMREASLIRRTPSGVLAC